MGRASTFWLLMLGVLAASGCATPTLRPQLAPSHSALDEQADVAFASERVIVRQPGASIGESVTWVRGIQDYTAATLNTLASAPSQDERAGETATLALRTEVAFDVRENVADVLDDDSAVRVLLWTTFPDGRQVHTERKGTLEDPVESLAEQACAISGPVLDAFAFAGALFLLSTTSLAAIHPVACGCLLGTALTGLAANAGHQGISYFFKMKKEERLSLLFADALHEHARFVVAAANRRAPPALSSETPPPTSAASRGPQPEAHPEARHQGHAPPSAETPMSGSATRTPSPSDPDGEGDPADDVAF